MTDRFDEMAGRVQMDLAAFAMPTGTSARRVIADALRAAHAGGVDEAAATIDLSMDDARELRRLALLGIERDERAERVRKDFAEEIVASMESNIENGKAVGAMGLGAGDEALVREGRLRELAAMFVREMVLACRFKDANAPKRDERAERVGRAVLLSFGYAPFTYYKWADALERHTLVTPARLLRAIADAMEEP